MSSINVTVTGAGEPSVTVASDATVNATVGAGGSVGVSVSPAGAPGPAGKDGVTPAFAVGTVSTLSAGSNATVTATTSNGGANVTLDFGLPQGSSGTSAGATTDASQLTTGTLADARLSANVPLLVNGLVPASMLPSYVDDVIDAGGTLPGSGEAGKIYVLSSGANANKVYRWSGSAFVEIVASPGSTDAVPEGSTNLYHTTQRAAAAAPVQSVAGRTGSVTLSAADIGDLSTAAVTKLNNLTGSLTLAAGSNVTITPSGSTLTIASTASGGGLDANAAVDGGDYVGEILLGITFTTQPQNVTTNSTTSVSLSSTNVSINSAVSARLYGLASYGNGLYSVAGKYVYSDWAISLMRSADNGATWQVSSTLDNSGGGAPGGLSQIASNGTRAVFVASGKLYHSDTADLSSVTPQTSSEHPHSVAWNGTRFVASGYSSIAIESSLWYRRTLRSSSDGVNWTDRFSGDYIQGGDGGLPILAIGGVFVLVRHYAVLTSTDGITWTSANVQHGWRWGVAASPNRIVSVGPQGSGTDVRWSTNGTTWNAASLPTAVTSVSYAAGLFWAFNSDTSGTDVYYSTDGASWTLGTMPASVSWLVAGASTSGSALIVGTNTSTNIPTYARATIGLTYATANLTVAATAASGNPVSFQWQSSLDAGTSWSNVANATNATLSLSNLTQADNGTRYRAFASATGAQSAYSQTALLTVTG